MADPITEATRGIAQPPPRADIETGMIVEREHGTWGTTNGLPASVDVIGYDDTAAAKIAIAHLMETRDDAPQYDYYDALELIEGAPKGIWRERGANYWMAARTAFVLLIVIIVIALVSAWQSESLDDAKYSYVIGVCAIAILYLKGDDRVYLV